MTASLCLWLATLLAAPAGAPAVAAKPSIVTERNVAVPMRDGVVLRADVHRPTGGGPFPVLVLRTPYGKSSKVDRYVQAGYIVVCQDARGRYASDGEWESFVRPVTHDGEDGYDTIEWAARLPGSNGKVGTFGASYNAFLQWRAAPLRPPSLVATSAFSIPARYTDLEGPGTIRPGRRLHWWVVGMSPDMRKRSGRTDAEGRGMLALPWNMGGKEKWLHVLPWADLPREAFENETEAVQEWLRHPHVDPWKLHESVDEIAVPNFNAVGWYDHCHGDMLLDRTIRSEGRTDAARTGSRTIIGPWGHVGRGNRRYANIDFGPEARLDLVQLEIDWFNYWLKRERNGVDGWPSYKIFVMGDNRWRDEPEWPPHRAQRQVLYLTSDGNANTPAGDGRLVAEPASAGTDDYVYDPRDPVPSLPLQFAFVIPADQRPLAKRPDILVYQTPPLAERLEVTGNPVVELYAASSAPDTDFFVRLIDVAPDGIARDVSSGMVRARYRDGLDDSPEPIDPGKVVRYAIRMGPTSNAFLPGHRLRLDVTSSDFPNYDRNHNTAAHQNEDAVLESASQTVHHGGPHASRIVLPCIAASPTEPTD